MCRPLKERGVVIGHFASVVSAALVAVIVTSLTAAPVWSNDGVPAGAEKIDRTHRQKTIIAISKPGESARLADFCLSRDGLVLAVVAGTQDEQADSKADARPNNSAAASEVRVFDRDGKLLRKWPLGFEGQTINVGADGLVYVGGNGQLAKYDLDGKLLAEAESPQVAILKNPEELKKQASEQLEADKLMADEQIKQFEAQLKELTKDDEKSLTAQQRQTKQLLEQQMKFYQDYRNRSLESVIASTTARLRMVNSVAASGQDVFIACPATKGYAYAVWRTDLSFQNPKQVIAGLNGCCGQMDVQTTNDEIFVAENSRHRVVRYDRDGKRLSSFGKNDREGLGEGFGGCCNPMNLCFTAEGGLFASESNGLVKHFTIEGKYVGMVGIADVPAGCKNSAIGVSSDGERVYYIDINRSKIIVLARQDDAPKKTD